VATLGEVATTLDITIVKVPRDANIFCKDNDEPLYFHMSNLFDIASGDKEINIAVMQLWMM